MPKFSRQKRTKLRERIRRKERLAIFRYVTDVFRVIDTIYRFFRMML